MKYIVYKRARFNGLSGAVNLPRGTKADEADGYIRIDGRPICFDHSQNAYDHFSADEDGNGLLRGKLVTAIKKTLAKKDANHQARWDAVWADERCKLYRRTDHTDFWVWNYEFYHAPIFELRHIAQLIGVPDKEMKL